MYSAFFKNHLAAAALALLTLLVMAAISAVPAVRDFGPGSLMSWAARVASGDGPDIWGALIVGIVLVVLATTVGWQVFKRNEL